MRAPRSRRERSLPGEFTSFVIALLMMYEPVKRLTGIHNIFQQAIGASQKVFEYLDHAEEIRDKPGAARLARFEKRHPVRQCQLSLSRSLERVPARFHPARSEGRRSGGAGRSERRGKNHAGQSGAAFLRRDFSGAVRIDGHDVRDLTLASLREKIGLVAQDTFLFNDTAANNISYGRPEISRDAIKKAAQSALAAEFIENLPQGYETLLGERGVKLSGGQRQRLAIARALLKNAPILILDEATSHLDTESEMLVQRALANLMAGPHGDRHRAPHLDHPPRRQDRRDRPRPHRRDRHARRSGYRRRHLSAAA